MVSEITRMKAPFYVQFELTNRCNNKCFFCYNEMAQTIGNELSLEKIKIILDEMKLAGVFKINFNGGEPTLRSDFYDIIDYAYSLGFDLHMNTNATLIDDYSAKRISKCMKSVCTSILHSDRDEHDKLAGRKGAYEDMTRGIAALVANNVGVEVNICTHKQNYKDIYNIAKVASDLGCYALCSTRYILTDKKDIDLLMDSQSTMEVIDVLLKIKDAFPTIYSVSLPGPVPYCELPEEYHDKLINLNIPCQYGYGLCRISATGKVTPCTISDDILADLNDISFSDMWNALGWEKYKKLHHIPEACCTCDMLTTCRGGCVVYDESIIACGVDIKSKKWSCCSEEKARC